MRQHAGRKRLGRNLRAAGLRQFVGGGVAELHGALAGFVQLIELLRIQLRVALAQPVWIGASQFSPQSMASSSPSVEQRLASGVAWPPRVRFFSQFAPRFATVTKHRSGGGGQAARRMAASTPSGRVMDQVEHLLEAGIAAVVEVRHFVCLR